VEIITPVRPINPLLIMGWSRLAMLFVLVVAIRGCSCSSIVKLKQASELTADKDKYKKIRRPSEEVCL
jgi:hypothetical protein